LKNKFIEYISINKTDTTLFIYLFFWQNWYNSIRYILEENTVQPHQKQMHI